MANSYHEILVTALDLLIAQLDEKLIELRRALAGVAIKYGIDSSQLAELQEQTKDTLTKREQAQTQRQRVLDQLAAGVSVAKLKQPGTLKQSELKLIEVSAEIMSTPPDGEDMAFTHSVLCQVGLPRSKYDGREFMRQSGAAWINVQAGWLDEGKGPVQQPVPYGPLPRLALAWISTQAVRTKEREIAIGNSASEFLQLLGKPTSGGVRGSYATLRKQMHALAACRLQLGFKGRTFNGQPVEQFDAWLSNEDTGQKALWPGVLVLSESYHKSLLESAVPLDNRALMALSDSALALDVYAWLAHRLHRIEGRGVTLHWKAIRDQFAQEYKGKDPDKDFKKEFLPALKKVLAVYPQAKVKPVKGGVLLLGSPPPSAYRG